MSAHLGFSGVDLPPFIQDIKWPMIRGSLITNPIRPQIFQIVLFPKCVSLSLQNIDQFYLVVFIHICKPPFLGTVFISTHLSFGGIGLPAVLKDIK